MTEQQPYEVVRTYAAFELRRYPAHVVAEVAVRSSFDQAGNIAFRSLFGYITGKNRSSSTVAMTAPVVQAPGPPEKVAMTAPVVQRSTGTDSHLIAFVLPASMTAESAPVPDNPDVNIRTVPATLAAAARYTGRWSQAAYQRHCTELLEAVAAQGLRPEGAPRFARFDPPFKPWFLRRNEVVVDVATADVDGVDAAGADFDNEGARDSGRTP